MKNRKHSIFVFIMALAFTICMRAQTDTTKNCILIRGKELLPGTDKNIEVAGTRLVGKTAEQVTALIGEPYQKWVQDDQRVLWYYYPKECDGINDSPFTMRMLFKNGKAEEALLIIE